MKVSFLPCGEGRGSLETASGSASQFPASPSFGGLGLATKLQGPLMFMRKFARKVASYFHAICDQSCRIVCASQLGFIEESSASRNDHCYESS